MSVMCLINGEFCHVYMSQVVTDMSQGEKNVQPDRDSNPGPFDYMLNAVLTELSGRLHIFFPISD